MNGNYLIFTAWCETRTGVTMKYKDKVCKSVKGKFKHRGKD